MINFKQDLRGFTLIELMITLVIGSVLAMVSIPALSTYKRNAQLSSATNTMFAAINAARSEAMKRNRNAFVRPADGALWTSGWVVFVDMDRSNTFNTGDIPVFNQAALPGYIDIRANGPASPGAPYIMFDSSGFGAAISGSSASNLTLEIKRNDVGATGVEALNQTRMIKIAITGRVRSCKPKIASDPTCLFDTATQ